MSDPATGIVYDKIFLSHDLPGHPENSKRLQAIITELNESGLWDLTTKLITRSATIDELKLCHSEKYINHVKNFCEDGGGYLDADTYTNEYSYQAAVIAVGGLIDLVKKVIDGELKNGFALLRPPGHHALADRSMGFCIFGNAAIAAKTALQNSKINKVAITDIDVHHGNGTQALVEDDPQILYVSTHQFPFYPGTGRINDTGKGYSEGTLLNVPLPALVSDDGITEIYTQIILPKIERFKPDLLIVSAGYDAHWDDPLANMGLSLSGYFWISQQLNDIAAKLCSSRIVFTLEGGYNLKVLSAGVANSIRVLLKLNYFDDLLGQSPFTAPNISNIIKELKTIHQL